MDNLLLNDKDQTIIQIWTDRQTEKIPIAYCMRKSQIKEIKTKQVQCTKTFVYLFWKFALASVYYCCCCLLVVNSNCPAKNQMVYKLKWSTFNVTDDHKIYRIVFYTFGPLKYCIIIETSTVSPMAYGGDAVVTAKNILIVVIILPVFCVTFTALVSITKCKVH